MSFILDALRKSENERQRNQQPGMVPSQGQGGRKASSIWLPLVALLIGVNIALLTVMWIMSNKSAPPAGPAQSRAPAAVVPDADERRITNQLPPRELTQPAPQPETPVYTAPVATAPAANDGDDSNVPTLEELLLLNAISVPELHLDIHVYSDDPTERFIFVNMARYNEGDVLSEGPRVVTITKQGVVLRHQGTEFLVTREQ